MGQQQQQQQRNGIGGGGLGGGSAGRMIQVPNDMVGTVIGRGGETIKMMQQASGCHIKVDQQNTSGPMRDIFLQGDPQQAETANSMIMNLIQQKQQQRSQMGGGMMGRGGGAGGGGGAMVGGSSSTLAIPNDRTGKMHIHGIRTKRNIHQHTYNATMHTSTYIHQHTRT